MSKACLRGKTCQASWSKGGCAHTDMGEHVDPDDVNERIYPGLEVGSALS